MNVGIIWIKKDRWIKNKKGRRVEEWKVEKMNLDTGGCSVIIVG